MKMERVYDVDLEDHIPLETYLRRVRPVNVIGNKNTHVLADLSRLWFRLGERHTGPEFVNMQLGDIPLNILHPVNSLDRVGAGESGEEWVIVFLALFKMIYLPPLVLLLI